METKGKQKGNMKVKELIKILKEVPNQNARVDLMIVSNSVPFVLQ